MWGIKASGIVPDLSPVDQFVEDVIEQIKEWEILLMEKIAAKLKKNRER